MKQTFEFLKALESKLSPTGGYWWEIKKPLAEEDLKELESIAQKQGVKVVTFRNPEDDRELICIPDPICLWMEEVKGNQNLNHKIENSK